VDRLIELDIDVFGTPPDRSRIRELVTRIAPLFQGCADGDVRGIVLNVGWVMDLVTEFSGDPDQRLPLRSRRLAGWAELTYRDLAETITMLFDEARDQGFDDLRVGPMLIGVGEFATEIVRAPDPTNVVPPGALYAEQSGWFERHPELFPMPVAVTLHGPGIDPRVPLRGDDHRYAARRTGIVPGEAFATFFAAQWQALCALVDFSILHLRDEFTTPVHAGRMGHDGGSTPATAEQITSWTDGVIALTQAIRAATPSTMLVLYSSGLAPTVDQRFGQLETHRLIAEGAVDVWIEQTWGGAWQDWWDAGWAGWTFQLAYLLQRGAIIAAANRERAVPCKRYKLIQGLDGWEPYDTFHDYPGKLRWGIWAFAHAAALDGDELTVPAGSYVAFLNDRTATPMSEPDVQWLATELDAAEASAAGVEEVFGPVMVADRASLQSLADHRPERHASEWVEEQVGLLLKWAVPVLAATTVETLPSVDPDAVVVQVPIGPDARRDQLLAGSPALVTGRADLLDPGVVSLLGIHIADDPLEEAGYTLGRATSADLRSPAWISMPPHARIAVSAETSVSYRSEVTPLLTRRGSVAYWQPPDWANPADRHLPHYQIGGVEPHIEAARLLQELLRDAGRLAVAPMAAHEPVCVHGWRSAGVVHLLLGNVESGWIGDARFARRVEVHVPDALAAGLLDPVLTTVPDGRLIEPTRRDDPLLIDHRSFEIEVPPEGCIVARLVERTPT
jgi:hypothetical protein